MISTRKQRALILLLRQQRGMTAAEYREFQQEHGLNDASRVQAGKIIGKLKQIRRLA